MLHEDGPAQTCPAANRRISLRFRDFAQELVLCAERWGRAQFKRLFVEHIDSRILHGPNEDVEKKDTAKDTAKGHAKPNTCWEEDSDQEDPLRGPLDKPPLDIHGDAEDNNHKQRVRVRQKDERPAINWSEDVRSEDVRMDVYDGHLSQGALQTGPSSQQDTKKCTSTADASKDSPKSQGQKWDDHNK